MWFWQRREVYMGKGGPQLYAVRTALEQAGIGFECIVRSGRNYTGADRRMTNAHSADAGIWYVYVRSADLEAAEGAGQPAGNALFTVVSRLVLKCFARRSPGGRWTAEERLRMPVPVRARAEKARRNGSFPPRVVRTRHIGAADGTRPKARLVLWTRRALPVQKQAFGTGSAWWRRASAGCPNRRCPRLGGCCPDTPRGAQDRTCFRQAAPKG